jgi:hypothetical protein
MLYGLCTMCATFASSVFSSADRYVQAEFGISNEVAILGLNTFCIRVSKRTEKTRLDSQADRCIRSLQICAGTHRLCCRHHAIALACQVTTDTATDTFGGTCLQPLSEIYGRKSSIVIPMFIFICLSAATATATDLQTLYITRFFAGVMASAPITNVGGVLADLYDQKDRGTAVVFYSFAVVAGPSLG